MELETIGYASQQIGVNQQGQLGENPQNLSETQHVANRQEGILPPPYSERDNKLTDPNPLPEEPPASTAVDLSQERYW